MSIFLVICLVVFLLPNVAFAWLQCIGSLIKIILFIFIVFLSFALIAGAGPTGQRHTGTAWVEEPFKNGFTVKPFLELSGEYTDYSGFRRVRLARHMGSR